MKFGFILALLIAGIGVWAVTGRTGETTPLKAAKLNIEHNATDNDTGFQGFVDSEGWSRLSVRGPGGKILDIRGNDQLRNLGLTELFFETVEPANTDVPITEMLAQLPEGNYKVTGIGMEAGDRTGQTEGTAWLTHTIPAGPVIVRPAANAEVVASEDLLVEWNPVTTTLDGNPVTIIAYELIIQKDEEPHPHMIGKHGLDMYLPSTVTTITVPNEILEPGAAYKWEVLAIEESGNQTLSSSQFRTR